MPPSEEAPLPAKALPAFSAALLGWHMFLRAPLHSSGITRAHWFALAALAGVVFGGILGLRAMREGPRGRAWARGALLLLLLLECLVVLQGGRIWSPPGLPGSWFCAVQVALALIL